LRTALLLCALACACAPAPVPVDDGGAIVDAGAAPDLLTILDEDADLARMAGENGVVKDLLPVAGAPTVAPIGDDCAFQNTARFPFHLQFLNAQTNDGAELTFADYVALVLARDTRVWWGGELAYDEARVHPLTEVEGVLAYSLYTQDEPADRLVPDDVRAVHAILVACAPAFAERLAFAPTSNEQRTTASNARAELHAEGIAVLAP
jgi:hypothetical protein